MSASPLSAPLGTPAGPTGGESQTSEVVLDVANISARYGDLAVLRDLTFTVQRGQIVALLGPNGCGKTTLLRIIGKLLVPSAGRVRVAGQDLATMSQLALSRIVATVSQVRENTFPFSVMDVLLTGRMPYVAAFASPKPADVLLCREVLDWFGIGHLEDKAITKLSGGERQLVMVARALAQEPRMLLLDEPTTFLDLRNQVRVLDTIHRLARARDLTVLMTMHDPNQALAYADRVVLLRRLTPLEGMDTGVVQPQLPATSIIASGDPAAVLNPANVLAAYGVAVDVIEHVHRRLIVPTD